MTTLHDSKEDDDGRDSTLEELRTILLYAERRDIADLQRRVDQLRVDPRTVSPTLYGAVRLHPDPAALGKALTPAVESAIRTSVLRDRRKLSTTLFPIIGPAIRQALQSTLRSMMQSLNQILDHSLSPRALGWRLEALRSDKTFAEIVLLNTLEYRVEELFLIEQPSGLLLQHVGGDSATAHADVVSGMLTAIQDFVRDSFGGSDSLGTMQLGDLTVLIETGPRALVAAVIRGTPPTDLRATLSDTVAHLHVTCADALDSGDADPEQFMVARPELEACLDAAYTTQPSRPSLAALVVIGALMMAVGAWVGLEIRDQRRWNAYTNELRAAPGILVAANGEQGGRRFISGLRDPLAVDPLAKLAEHDLDANDIDSTWQPYHAHQPAIVLTRCERVLEPPATVAMTLDDGTLRVRGHADRSWIERLRRMTPAIAGITVLDASHLIDDDVARTARERSARVDAVARASERLAKLTIEFDARSSALTARGRAAIDEAAEEIRRLNSAANALGHHALVEVVAAAATILPAHDRSSLSRARANLVITELRARGIGPESLAAVPLDDRPRTAHERTARDTDASRTVRFRVVSRNAGDAQEVLR